MQSELPECCNNTGLGGAQTCLPQQLLTVNTSRQGRPGGMCARGDTCHMCMCRWPSEWGRDEQEAGAGKLHAPKPALWNWASEKCTFKSIHRECCQSQGPAQSSALRAREAQLEVPSPTDQHGLRSPAGSSGSTQSCCPQTSGSRTNRRNMTTRTLVFSTKLRVHWLPSMLSKSSQDAANQFGFSRLFHSCTHVPGQLWPLINVTQVCA